MAGVFKSLKRVFMGKVLCRKDMPLYGGLCTMSLRLKQDRDGRYVVLASVAPGNYQYFAFDLDEFAKFVESANEIHAAAQGGRT